ncbi:inorganic diphosphatase [Psychroserpens sp.]|nr:inorganic diphosphatase [Psychroserpens sp.]
MILLMFSSCETKVDYGEIPLYSSNNNIQAVIEIPAGTNKKIEYNKTSKAFEIDKKNGKDRVIDFLPYIGNYGFFPSTFSNPDEGGDGDAIDVLVLSENVSTGTIIEVKPIAIMKLIDDGELDYKIIAVPIDKKMQIIKANNYLEFSENYAELKQIIELWFYNYNKDDTAVIKGWGSELEALNELKHSSL